MKCPQCRTQNTADATECDGCGVVFRDLRRTTVARQDSPQLCSWMELGRSCPSRGIIHTGRWYCREHWERSRNIEPGGTGNYPVTPQRSMDMKSWDGWHEEWLKRRDRKQQMPNSLPSREPGDDDDYADLVPETVGQA